MAQHDAAPIGIDGPLGRSPRANAIISARAGEEADRFHRHVVVADDLARQAEAGVGVEAAGGEEVLLGLGYAVRFALDELHSTGRTARVPAARV